MRKLLRLDFVRFCLVGALGFCINFFLLTLFYKIWGIPLFIAQLIAAEIALFSNFLFHHHWTYKHHNVGKAIATLLWQFHATSWTAIIGTAVIVSFCVQVLQWSYIAALVLAGFATLLWNFVWTKFVIWRHRGEAGLKAENSEEHA
jgi:putative flippase GtrA